MRPSSHVWSDNNRWNEEVEEEEFSLLAKGPREKEA